jgi:hypothetical protein
MSVRSEGDAVSTARDLRLALDELSEACVVLDLDRMLEAEAGLAAALTHARARLAPPADTDALTREIDALQRSFQRATRLGASLEELVRMSAGVVTPAAVYDRAGRERSTAHERALEAHG